MVSSQGRDGHRPQGNGRAIVVGGSIAGLLAARVLSEHFDYDAIEGARPCSSIAGYRGTENRLRHYESLTRWPDRFVVLGDAVCAFNSIHGQGMTAAALGAVTLDRCLREYGFHRTCYCILVLPSVCLDSY